MEQTVPSELPVILRSGRLCLPQGQVLDFTLSCLFLLLLQNTLNSLCFSPLPFHASTHSPVFQKLFFCPLLTCFPPPLLNPSPCSQLLTTNHLVFYLFCLLSILLVSTSLLSFLLSDSNILLPVQHIKLLLPMFS